MSRRTSLRTAVAIALIGCVTNAKAALIPLDLSGIPGQVNAYYDTVLNITWLRDANYAATSGFASGGLMSFGTAQSWAAGLDIYGITGWSVANVAEPDPSCSSQTAAYGSTGLNCTGGELGYMFYVEMGGSAGTNITQSHNATFNLFINLGDNDYWSATALTPNAGEGYINYSYFFTRGTPVAPLGMSALIILPPRDSPGSFMMAMWLICLNQQPLPCWGLASSS